MLSKCFQRTPLGKRPCFTPCCLQRVSNLDGGGVEGGGTPWRGRTVSPGGWPGNSCARCIAWPRTRALPPAFHSEKQNMLSREKLLRRHKTFQQPPTPSRRNSQCVLWTGSVSITRWGGVGGGAYWKCRVSGPSLGLWNLKLQFNKIPRGLTLPAAQ